MKTTVSSRGRIALPAQLRRRDGIKAGQKFAVERLEYGRYLLKRQLTPPNDGVVDWLLACPEKGYFVPVGSASIDTM